MCIPNSSYSMYGRNDIPTPENLQCNAKVQKANPVVYGISLTHLMRCIQSHEETARITLQPLVLNSNARFQNMPMLLKGMPCR